MTKHFVRAAVTKVTGWCLDEDLVDERKASAEGLDERKLRAETKARLEDCTDDGRENLPFVYEFTVPGKLTEQKVHDALVEKFASEFYRNDYVFPVECKFTWETLMTYEED